MRAGRSIITPEPYKIIEGREPVIPPEVEPPVYPNYSNYSNYSDIEGTPPEEGPWVDLGPCGCCGDDGYPYYPYEPYPYYPYYPYFIDKKKKSPPVHTSCTDGVCFPEGVPTTFYFTCSALYLNFGYNSVFAWMIGLPVPYTYSPGASTAPAFGAFDAFTGRWFWDQNEFATMYGQAVNTGRNQGYYSGNASGVGIPYINIVFGCGFGDLPNDTPLPPGVTTINPGSTMAVAGVGYNNTGKYARQLDCDPFYAFVSTTTSLGTVEGYISA